MSVQLVVAGHFLAPLTKWGDLEWSLCWPGYSDELTFDVARHPGIFRPGVPVSLVWGGRALWSGTLDVPVRGERLRAAGLWRLGEKYAALDSGGALSRIMDTSIDAAIVRGLPWVRDVVHGGAYVENLGTDSPSTVTQVVEANVGRLVGYDWGVLPTGVFDRRTRTTPRLHVRPGGDGLGIAWDNYASTLIARYLDSGTSLKTTKTRTDATAAARWGAREAVVPGLLNDGASMSSATASDIVDAMLANGRSRPGWTAPIEVTYGAVTNNMMQPVDLATIKPYETIRVHGLSEDVGDLGGRTWVDMHIERIRHAATSTVITPVGLVSPMRDLLTGKR